MIGGDLSFSSGGYYGTPVAEALPVELSPPFGEPDRLIVDGGVPPPAHRRGPRATR